MERECWQETDEGVIERLRQIESRSRQLYGDTLHVMAEIEGRGLVGSLGYPNLVELLRDVARVSRAEGRRRIQHMVAVQASEPLAGAAAEGVVGPEHIAT